MPRSANGSPPDHAARRFGEVTRRVRQRRPTDELAIRRVGTFPFARQRLAERRANIIRHRPPRRPIVDRRELVEHVVDHLLREAAERGPVVRRDGIALFQGESRETPKLRRAAGAIFPACVYQYLRRFSLL
jgi:hypothetical protein